MRLRHRALSIALVGTFAVSTMAASSDEPIFTEGGLLVTGTDEAGDWGSDAGADDASALGESSGQDLLQAAVGLDPEDPATLLFEITVSELPSLGGMPEATRYTYNFSVDGEFAELDGKFTNYSRGACDPTANSCPPPRDPGPAPFTLRGNCTVNDANVTTCEELGAFVATFDAAAGTITIPVPLESIAATECTRIGPEANLFGGSVSAAPSAFFTSSAMPLDVLFVTETYFIPKADGTECPKPE